MQFKHKTTEEKGREGDTVFLLCSLEATISTDGSVIRVEVLEELPAGLTEAAVAAVETWKYKPAELDGKAVEHTLSVALRFQAPELTGTVDPVLLALLDTCLADGFQLHSLSASGTAAELIGGTPEGAKVAQLMSRLSECPALASEARLESMKMEDGVYRFRITFELAP